MRFTEYIGRQFGNPKGLLGEICCLIMNFINRKQYKVIISDIEPKDTVYVLDIGVGNGYLVKKLYNKTNGYIFGIDISKDILNRAISRNKKGIAQNKVNLTIGDCCNLNFKDNTFDIVTTINTIYFWNDTLRGLKEINRVLKKDGIFKNVVYSKEWLQTFSYTKTGFKFFEEKDYIEYGKKAGFKDVLIEKIEDKKSYIIQYIK